MQSKAARSNLMLVITAVIWGIAFVAQRVGMDYIGPFTFNAVRNLLGVIVLTVLLPVIDRIRGEADYHYQTGRWGGRVLIAGGIVCGLFLTIASCLQQVGIQYTSVGEAGFLTAMYIILVPVLGIFIRKKVPFTVWISVVLAVCGMYLLCMTGGSLTISKGNILEILCALFFAFQILAVDYFSPKCDGVRLSMLQFLVCGSLCLILALIFEHPTIAGILSAWIPIAYAGVLSCGVGYTFQILAQKNTDPVIASLLMSLESVFSLIAGWIILGQKLSPSQLAGCAIMFGAIVLAQLRPKRH